MNESFKRRLVGLLVLLVAVFALSLLLPRDWTESGEKGVPSTTLALTTNGDSAAPAVPDATAPAPGSPAAMAATTAKQSAPPPAAASQVATAAPANGRGMPEEVDSTAPALDLDARPHAATSSTPPTGAAPPPAKVVMDKSTEQKAADQKAAAQKQAQAAPATADTKPKDTSRDGPKVPALKLSPSMPLAAKPAPAMPPVPAAKNVAPPVVANKMATAMQAPPPVPAPGQVRLWYVQIGSFADQGNAQTTLNLLQNIGFRGESSQVSSATGATLYRVRLGPFPSEAVAQQALTKVSHQGYPQARVLSEAAGGKK
jgi:cell division protein FtsN